MEHGKEINHWCVLCGTGYHACDSCNKEKTFTPWRTLTDTIEHYKIFTVLKDYNNKMIDRDRAKELLSGLDLSGEEDYKESSKKVLADIYMSANVDTVNIDASPKRKTRKSVIPTVENTTIPEKESEE